MCKVQSKLHLEIKSYLKVVNQHKLFDIILILIQTPNFDELTSSWLNQVSWTRLCWSYAEEMFGSQDMVPQSLYWKCIGKAKVRYLNMYIFWISIKSRYQKNFMPGYGHLKNFYQPPAHIIYIYIFIGLKYTLDAQAKLLGRLWWLRYQWIQHDEQDRYYHDHSVTSSSKFNKG
jgi:hypothetical protein